MRGFTFVEIVIVVAILGIIAAVAAPVLVASLGHARLYGAVSEAATAIKYAQATASSTGSPTTVTIDETAETIVLERTSFDDMADILDPGITELDEEVIETEISIVPLEHPLKKGEDYLVDFTGDSRFSGVDIVSVAGGNTITFDSRGIPSAGIQITLAVGTHTASISIDPLTGRVTTTL